MQLSKAELRRIWKQDRQKELRHLLIAVAVTVAVFLFCLCFRYNAYFYEDPFIPAAYFKSFCLAVRLLFARLMDAPLFYQSEEAIEAIGSITYYGALARLRITMMALVAGAGLSIAGAIFQAAYRNPMASPNILGATAGVNLGNVLVVMLYSAAAYEHILLRYQFCYGFTAICVCLVLLLGKLAGNKRENYSVMEMVMAGAIISQMMSVFTMYIFYNLEDADMLLYEEINLGTYLQTDFVSMAIFFSVMAVSILPVLLMRYRLNAIGMDKLETTALGIRTAPLRIVGQLCGVIMVTCAMIHCGEIGMITMVIPYIVRRVVGADFRRVCIYSALSGGVLLMLCRLATSFIYVADAPIPVTFLINLVLTPAFMVILARHRREF